jgi:phosphoglycolate phosphatase-like HAD superfamily hydrolase
MIRLVLFDIDGTLIHSGGAGEKAFARVCAVEFNVPNGTERLRFAGRTDTSIVREFFSRHEISPTPENFRRFFDHYVFWLDHMLGQLSGRVLPGVSEMIRRLGATPAPPVIGLLTGNIRLGAQIKLTHYGLWEHFVIGGFGDDHEDRNQIAVIARERACQRVGRQLQGEEILVIGDTPLDIACARAINARVLAVATGSYRAEQLRPHEPNWTVEDLEAVNLEEICA